MTQVVSAINDIPERETFWVRGSNADGHVNILTSGFRVAGVLRLESIENQWTSGITITNGDLTILQAGMLAVNAGSGGPRLIAGNLVNQGTVNAGFNLALDAPSAQYVNLGNFNIARGRAVVMHGRGQVFRQASGTLLNLGALDLQNSTFRFIGGKILSNEVTLADGVLEISSSANAEPGLFAFTGSSSTHQGDVGSAQALWIRGSNRGQHTLLTASNGFANAGTLRLESIENQWTSSLTVKSGRLTNTSNGTIQVSVGGGGPRVITASVRNLGTVKADFDLSLATPGGAFDNEGVFAIAPGRTVSMNGAAQVFAQRGGSIALNGALDLESASFVYRGGAINGNAVTLVNSLLDTEGAAADPAAFITTGPSGQFRGNLDRGQLLWIRGSNRGQHTLLTASDGFANAGTLRLESIENQWSSSLTVKSGRLTNAANGVIQVSVGGGGTRVITASVRNLGTVKADFDLGLATPGGTFDNEGALVIAPGRTVSMSGAAQVFAQRAGSIALNGALDLVSATFVYRGGAINGNAVTLVNSLLDTEGAAADPAAFITTGPSGQFRGNLDRGQLLWIRGSNRGQHTLLTASDGFANAGTLRLESIENQWTSSLTVKSGRLTNAANGVIQVSVGGGGTRVITASVRNLGTVKADFDLSLATPGGAFDNEGAFVIAPGRTVSMSGAAQVFAQRAGSIALNGALDLESAVFAYRGGPVVGNAVTLVNSLLDTEGAAADPAAFAMTGPNSQFRGNLNQGQLLWIRGSNRGQHTLLTASNGFANAGTLRLESIENQWTSSLTVKSGRLTNAPGGVLEVNTGAGGPRFLGASVLNHGSLMIRENLAMDSSGSALANAGDINIAARKTLAIAGPLDQTAGSIVLKEGSISAGGGFRLSGGSLAGNGIVDAAVANEGAVLSPGIETNLGVLTVSRKYTQQAKGLLRIKLGGSVLGGNADQLRCEAEAQLDGTLEIVLASNFLPAANSRFDLLTAKAIAGNFTRLALPVGMTGRLETTSNKVSLVVLSAVPTTNPPPTVACTLPPPGLIAWWPGGNEAKDLIGGHRGSLQNFDSIVRMPPGKVGAAFQLDGIDDVIVIPDHERFTPKTGLAVEAWVSLRTLKGDHVIVSHYDTSAGQPSWALLVLDGGKLRMSMFESGGLRPIFQAMDTLNPVVATNQFHHVAGVFDLATHAMRLFVDGQEASAAPVAGSTEIKSIFNSASPVRIGAIVNASGRITNHFAGVIDELSVYGRALAAPEVSAIHAAGAAGKCTSAPYLLGLSSTETVPVGTAVNRILNAVLGIAPYRYTIDSGELPPGIKLIQFGGETFFGGAAVAPGIFDLTIGVTDAQGTKTSQSVRVVAAPSPPTLARVQLADLTVTNGGRAVFKVSASGAVPLTYQWRFGSTPIPGAIKSEFVIPSASNTHEGFYSVVVANSAGSVTSRVARLRVLVPPTITLQPLSQIVLPGGSAILRVGVLGDGPFFFQWRRNGEPIPGATNVSLSLGNFQRRDSGVYSVAVASKAGSLVSSDASVGVPLLARGFADEFAARGVIRTASGDGGAITVNASREAGEPNHAGKRGGRSVWLSWVAPVSGVATFATRGSSIDTLLAVYTGSAVNALTPVTSDEDNGGFFASSVSWNAIAGQAYEIAVDAFGGKQGAFAFEWDLIAAADPVPVIVQQPMSLTLLEGGTAVFTVVASNPPPASTALTYRWFVNRVAISGANSASLTISNVAVTDLGVYVVEVAKASQSVRSQPARLQVNVNESGAATPDLSSEDKFLDATLAALGAQPAAGLQGADQRLGRGPGRPAGGLASGYSGAQVFNTSGSTTESGEPSHCGVIGGASQWFSYRAEADGELTITTDGSDFDTVLGVYTGSGEDFESLQQIGCDNDGGTDGFDSTLRLDVSAQTTYYVAVDGVNGASGTVRLNYSLAAPPRFTGLTSQNNQWQLRLSGQPGATYVLEESSDLKNWTIRSQTNAASGSFEFLLPVAPSDNARFYRAYEP